MVSWQWPLTFLAVPIFLVTFLSACAGPPHAQVVASATAGQAPLSVNFTNQSKNAGEFQWDFGDGATMTTTKEKQVAHEYTELDFIHYAA